VDFPFIHGDFLLESDAARRLFHTDVESLPIVDYHCHLPSREIADNHQFANIAEAWLGGDHYKWRAMRANGIPESHITGDASDREKFQAWAETVPNTIRNPLYHWTHMELAQIFDIHELLNPDSAESIWNQCNEQLAEESHRAQGLIERFNVEFIGTTDDPLDSLEHHKAIAQDTSLNTVVRPAWRPDKAMAVEKPELFNAWTDELFNICDEDTHTLDTFLDCIRRRQAHFHQNGCRLSDHGIDILFADQWDRPAIEEIFTHVRSGNSVSPSDIQAFRSFMLHELLTMNHNKGWVQQLHLGAIRNANTTMAQKLGPDTGYDSMGDRPLAEPLNRVLDRLSTAGTLSPTIMYNNNPKDNEVIATAMGNFQDGSRPGKMQFGAGWWHLDQIDGMMRQMETLSSMGLLSQFVGMVTDSRSFLSYPRHDYFRRILCNLLGGEMENGRLPNDFEFIGSIAANISYHNAHNYFDYAEE
jgi:glucuronate isomerase